MSKSVRIPVTAGSGDKYVSIKLEQDYDTIEILSLKLNQKDLYGSFNSDFGVLIGRVIANEGIGIPNAKISIFIPINSEDQANADILSIYPYTSPQTLNSYGVRYNLLPRVAVGNPFITQGQYAPTVPIGTFPTKEEITTNQTFFEVFEKYYKYTTVTNTSGDYMIYGVPIGTQTAHMSVDITDIGQYSMTPGTMITNLGYSPNLFSDNGTKVKFSTDLSTLPNVETQEISVDVKPFWGDSTNFQIGITRQDFKIKAVLISSFTIFGSAFTDAQNASWGSSKTDDVRDLYRMGGGQADINPYLFIDDKRNGLMNETIFFIPNTISDADAASGNFDTKKDYQVLQSNQYTKNVDNGVFVYQIACNRKKVITNESGKQEIISNNDPRGVFTEFIGFVVFRYGDLTSLPIDRQGTVNGNTASQYRMFLKFPQDTSVDLTTDNTFELPDTNAINETWRKQHHVFSGSNFYSIARFVGIRGIDGSNNQHTNQIGGIPPATNSGLIITNTTGQPSAAGMVANQINIDSGGADAFAIEWLNFCAYFPQITTYPGRLSNAAVTSYLTVQDRSGNYILPNTQLIGDSQTNTQLFGRSDINRTAFINVPKTDILKILNYTISNTSPQGFINGFTNPYNADPLIGTDYKSLSGSYYFYKGLTSSGNTDTNGAADVFLYMRSISVI